MKAFIRIFSILILLFFLNGCVILHPAGKSGKVPPGQEKKVTGEKSAKKHAPGQEKKK